MVFEVGLFAETSVTDMTLVGPSTSVDICMRLEITWGWERLAAHCTFVWLFLQKVNVGENILFFFKVDCFLSTLP